MKLFPVKENINNSKLKNIRDFKKILNTGKFILGKNVFNLEKKLKKITNSKYCISTSSGTDALLISLMSIGLKPKDEVITTAFTYVSTAEVILRLGAKPVFVDIDKSTGLIDENEIEKHITSRTKAIIPVSLFGLLPDFKKINSISKKYNLKVIEDGAQSFGSGSKKQKSGNLSDIACTSFYPTKNLGCFGDGGAIFTNSKSIAKKCFLIRAHGENKRYNSKLLGVCGRLDEIQAMVLLNKLRYFKSEISKRISNGKKLRKILSKLSLLTINPDIAYNTFPIILKDNRRSVMNLLSKLNIEYNIIYPKPLHRQPFMNKFKYKKLKNTEFICKSILSIPCHPYLSKNYFTKIKKIFTK